jgi:hypothetical protein
MNTVKIEEAQPLETASANVVDHKNRNRIITCSILIIILLVVCLRTPYVGSFIDGSLFDFLFGYLKYLIYLYLFLLLNFIGFFPNKRF